MKNLIKSIAALLLVAITSTGCSLLKIGNEQVAEAAQDETEQFEEQTNINYDTGESVIALSDSVLFSRIVPGISKSARDYLYIGPVETDRMGTRGVYLWVGMASTIDRGHVGVQAIQATELRLKLDGKPLTVPLLPWHDNPQDTPFKVSVPLQRSLRAEVSMRDLHRIAEAQKLEIGLADESGKYASYKHWHGERLAWSSLTQNSNVGLAVQVYAPPTKDKK